MAVACLGHLLSADEYGMRRSCRSSSRTLCAYELCRRSRAQRAQNPCSQELQEVLGRGGGGVVLKGLLNGTLQVAVKVRTSLPLACE